MDDHREAGQWIEARRRALAEAVVARQYETQPGLPERYGEGGRAKCVQDTEYHLSYLATAVMYASPALFSNYIAWAKSVLAAFGVVARDVEQNLVCLRDVLARELPGAAGSAAVACVDASLRVLPEAPTHVPTFLDREDALGEVARQYLQTLLLAERHEASRLVLGAIRAGVSVGDIYLHVFQPCQREVGRLWQLKQITVAQEHYCTAATQLAMSQLYPYLFALPKTGRKMAAVSVGGELHEVGLRIVTDLFEADGWDTLYLGANLPASGVIDALELHRPDLLVVSVTMTFHLASVERLIAQVRSSPAGRNIKIMVGGYPFNVAPNLWQRLRADGHAIDAGEALIVAARLLNVPHDPSTSVPKTYSADVLAEVLRGRGTGRRLVEASYDELSRLNSDLVTAQRELARKNAQLERLNERLTEADQRKDEFLAMLAHELRNPLAPLRNAAHLLQQPGLDRPSVERTGEMMGRQVQQLGRLVDDLLDLSRIARGKMELRKETLDLGEAVRRAADVSRPLIDARRHELRVSLPSTPLRLQADPTRLEQVLTNLLNNAARYTPEGGCIWLTAEREGDDAVVKVRDTGIGIPPEMRSRIFGLFSQVARAEERRGGGLGIGLSLVKSLTEMHGGTVEAHSEGPGRGSEFVVRWPLPFEHFLRAPRTMLPAPSVMERTVRVLLVDDSVDAANSLAMLLRLWGHEAMVANDGPGALRLVEEQHPEVALLDIGLPGMDGYELARQLRRRPELGSTVFVALTGWGQEEHRHRSLAAGFHHHLVKPVELAALQQLLASA